MPAESRQHRRDCIAMPSSRRSCRLCHRMVAGPAPGGGVACAMVIYATTSSQRPPLKPPGMHTTRKVETTCAARIALRVSFGDIIHLAIHSGDGLHGGPVCARLHCACGRPRLCLTWRSAAQRLCCVVRRVAALGSAARTAAHVPRARCTGLNRLPPRTASRRQTGA